MGNNMKKVESLEELRLLVKGISEAIKNETKEQKGGFLAMLLGTLDASILENVLSGTAGEGVMRPSQNV